MGLNYRKKEREKVEHEIRWEIKSRSTNVWYENWSKLGALYDVVSTDFPIDETVEDVTELIEEGRYKGAHPTTCIPRRYYRVHQGGDSNWDFTG